MLSIATLDRLSKAERQISIKQYTKAPGVPVVPNVPDRSMSWRWQKNNKPNKKNNHQTTNSAGHRLVQRGRTHRRGHRAEPTAGRRRAGGDADDASGDALDVVHDAPHHRPENVPVPFSLSLSLPSHQVDIAVGSSSTLFHGRLFFFHRLNNKKKKKKHSVPGCAKNSWRREWTPPPASARALRDTAPRRRRRRRRRRRPRPPPEKSQRPVTESRSIIDELKRKKKQVIEEPKGLCAILKGPN